MERIQETQIIKDLKKKMVFLVGPRQVGKTWLSKHISKLYKHPQYLNYDHAESRSIIQNEQWPLNTDLLIFDEIHKMPEWKNYLKGIFDTKPPGVHILVTGSARLDVFRQAGDSLAGRFFIHHLLPLSPSELHAAGKEPSLDRLISCGGFPEPFLAETEADGERWRATYIDGLLRNDILDFENIHNFNAMKMLFELLRRRIGSPISMHSLSEDLHISVPTVSRYLEIMEMLYIIFRITPYSKNIARAILKEPKVYFFDTGLVIADEGIKYENCVAVSLLKNCLYKSDISGKNFELHYVRNKEGKEVDFALTTGDTLDCLIEAKLSDAKISPALKYFTQHLAIPGIQLVNELRMERQEELVEVRKAEAFLKAL